jgi:hypothetical protein
MWVKLAAMYTTHDFLGMARPYTTYKNDVDLGDCLLFFYPQ